MGKEQDHKAQDQNKPQAQKLGIVWRQVMIHLKKRKKSQILNLVVSCVSN